MGKVWLNLFDFLGLKSFCLNLVSIIDYRVKGFEIKIYVNDV